MAETETGELRDREITLGTGKLLGIFFGLALLCALFFTMGYMLGRNNAASGKTEIVGGDTGTGSANKPSAVNKTGQTGPTANSSGNQANPAVPAVSPVAAQTSTPAAAPAIASNTPPTEVANVAPSGATYVVQVAAVSKREDADLMVSGLQKKQYPAFVASAGDALFHVQVGPFNDAKDAETIRTRLVGEGYNPIVKRSN